jgi:hypothetical protein
MLSKKIILLLALALLILSSGCKSKRAAHLLNPDTYSSDRSEPWEKNPKPQKKETIKDKL